MSFKISVSGTEVTVSISGKIDEKFLAPTIPVDSAKHLAIHLEKVDTINSLGIQKWIEFTETIPSRLHISLICCPPCIVLQINMLQRFLPTNARVESVMVPFYCNSCDSEFTEKHIIGKDVTFKDDLVYLNKSSANLCKDENCDVETDINREKFFHFLKTTRT